MKYKDLDSQQRFQKAWDAMLAQANQKVQSTRAQPEPKDESCIWPFLVGVVTGLGICVLINIVRSYIC